MNNANIKICIWPWKMHEREASFFNVNDSLKGILNFKRTRKSL